MKQVRSSIALLCALVGITTALVVVVNLVRADSFTLTINKIGQGQVVANPLPPYIENQVVSLTAVPDSGWEFVSWAEEGAQGNWWDSGWDFRVPVTVNADGFQRKNKPAEVEINFKELITSLGKPGTFDPNSIRVVEVDQNGTTIDDDVAFQYNEKQVLNEQYNPNTANNVCSTLVPGTGTVTFIMKGVTSLNANRYYQIYFDVASKGIPAKNVPPQITLIENAFDPPAPDPGGQSSFKIATQAGTYFYQKKGAGFSSLNDANDNDWISFSGTPGSGAGGEFRGIPNLVLPNNGGLFHPGTVDNKLNTCLIYNGPLKTTIYSIYRFNNKERWMVTWDMFPTYARMTILAARYDYWFLYEGTPGGALEGNSDFITRSDGTQTNLSQAWSVALAPEQWVFISDPTVGRSLFAAQHGADNKKDWVAVGGTNQMNVFGFGRDGTKAYIPQDNVPEEFTIGLIDTTTYADAAPMIRSAYKDLQVTTGAPELYSGGGSLGDTNPVNVTITGNNVVTATFALQAFELNLTADGQGTVTKTPNKTTYGFNEQVTIKATPTNPDWGFVQWEGDVVGIDPLLSEQVVTMTVDRDLTAKFLPFYSIDTAVVGEGTIALNPSKEQYFTGDVVDVTANAASGWSFAGWSGDLTGSNNPEQLTIDGDKSVTATFTQDEYTLTVETVGNGTADWEPKQDTYHYGDDVTLTATADVGYFFTGWTGSFPSSDAIQQIVITGNATVTANFSEVSFRTLTVAINGEGTVERNPDLPEYETGTVVTLTAVPTAGWAFTGWTGDLNSTTNPDTITITDDSMVTANFAPAGPYTLAVGHEGNGSVTIEPQKDEYAAGEAVKLTPVAAQGWVFANWKGDLTGTENPKTITMDQNKTITAVFVQPGTSGPLTDNFDTCALNSQWTFVNPLGDGQYSLNGTQLRLSVPAGIEHNFTENGNDGVRVMQKAADDDFVFDVKFVSALAEDGTDQGVIIEQDAGNFIRYDVYKRNGVVTIFAARFENLVATKVVKADIAPPTSTLYLRTVRAGDNWELLYSFDGVSWSTAFNLKQTLVVQSVGIYAGNFKVKNNTPAHTAVVDYFYNTADAVKPGDVSLLTVTVNGNGLVQRSAPGPYTCGQTVNLTALPNTGAQFMNWSGDASGSQNPLPLVLNARKTITATFSGGQASFEVNLPFITQP